MSSQGAGVVWPNFPEPHQHVGIHATDVDAVRLRFRHALIHSRYLQLCRRKWRTFQQRNAARSEAGKQRHSPGVHKFQVAQVKLQRPAFREHILA